MRCPKCSRELRIAPEQVGVDSNNMPVYHRFGYCDTCMTKTDLDVVQAQQQSQVPAKEEKKKHSGLSTAACICSLFGCTIPIAILLAIIDLCINDKSKRHMGSWFALIFSAICVIVLGPNILGSSDKVEKGNDAPKQTETSIETTEEDNEDNIIGPGEYFEIDGLKVTVVSATTEYTDYENEYGFYDLEAGYKYIEVSFTYENNGDSDKYVSIYDYDCYADGTLCEQTYYFGGDFVNANLSSGRNVSFETYFIVPSDAEQIELEYTTNVWTDEKVIVKIQ